MTKERKIVGIWPTEEGAANDLPIVLETLAQADRLEMPPPPAHDDHSVADDALWLTLDEPQPTRSRGGWVAPILGVLTAAGWAIFVTWTQSAGFVSLPQMHQWPMVAVMICAPIMLILLTNLLIERTSGRSVNRHLDAMTRMREEHQQLVERLSVIDQHWQQAQATLNMRSLTLADTALQAGQRLSEVSSALDERMHRAVNEAAAINQQGEAARRAMEALLVALPKIDEVSQRATEAMRESGQIAYQYGGQLEAQIAAVRHESIETEQTLSAVNAQLAERIAKITEAASDMDASSLSAAERFGASLNEQRDAALAMVADLAVALEQSAATSEERLTALRVTSGEATRSTIDALDTAIAHSVRQASVLTDALATSLQDSEKLGSQLGHVTEDTLSRFASMEAQSTVRIRSLESLITSFQQSLDALGDNSMAATDQADALAQRADTVVTLLKEAQNDLDVSLPAALERLHTIVAQSQECVGALPETIGVSASDSAALLSCLRNAEQSLGAQSTAIEVIEARMAGVIGAQTNSIGHLHDTLDALAKRMREIAGGDTDALKASLASVDEQTRTIVEDTAGKLEQALADALDKATGNAVDERLASIAGASDNAVRAASAASERLMRQLLTIADSSAALEARANEVNTVIETSGRDTLARQMASLTEAMQSTSVDITRLIDSDVADQAWEAYLKGDRSIFSRRALRLLNAAEAKELLRRYENDEEFHALVNRYIYDFEVMLRGIMDTRDGGQLSVILLSSDIGKIYVALAQAIERLRH